MQTRLKIPAVTLLLCGLIGLTATAAQAQQDRPRLRALAQRLQEKRAGEERPVDLQAIAPGARKLTQSYGTDDKQQIDVYLPPNAKNAPILVMVHGGAWKLGDKANAGVIENKLKHWLPKGFIVVSVNYRLLPEAMADEQARDVAEAVKWVQAYAGDWGGSEQKIILMGHSAGAHLVALLSARPEQVGRPWAGTVVLDSAVLRVSDVMGKPHQRFYDEAFGSDPAAWAAVSPMDQWSPAAVPMMLVCSSQRPDKPCAAAEAFQAKARAAGRPMPVLPQALSHGEINQTLGLDSPYTAAVDAFIAGRLGRR
jgi:arylformamidase